MTEVAIYFINLDTRQDRRQQMELQFNHLGLSAQRIAATTVKDLLDAEVARYCAPHRLLGVDPVELATSVSHRRVWQAFVDSGAPRCLVLEDDVILSAALPVVLASMELAPDLPDLVKLDTVNNALRQRSTGLVLAGRFKMSRLYSCTHSSAAYVLSRRLALTLLAAPRHLRVQVDLALFNPYGVINDIVAPHQLSPAVAITLDNRSERTSAAVSDIADGRERQSRHQQKLAVRLAGFARATLRDIRAVPSRFMQYLVWRVPKVPVAFAPE